MDLITYAKLKKHTTGDVIVNDSQVSKIIETKLKEHEEYAESTYVKSANLPMFTYSGDSLIIVDEANRIDISSGSLIVS
jgi:hypothetical protein